MASKNKIIEMIGAIKTIYSYYAKDTDASTLVNTWLALFKEYNDNEFETAVYKCLQTCKMPPTPADVMEKINEVKQANLPSNEELWSKLIKALDKTSEQTYKFRFTFVEPNGKTQGEIAKLEVQKIWDKLEPELQQYFGSKGEMIIMSNSSDEDLKYEKNRFLKTIPQMVKRATLLIESENKKLKE